MKYYTPLYSEYYTQARKKIIDNFIINYGYRIYSRQCCKRCEEGKRVIRRWYSTRRLLLFPALRSVFISFLSNRKSL